MKIDLEEKRSPIDLIVDDFMELNTQKEELIKQIKAEQNSVEDQKTSLKEEVAKSTPEGAKIV